MNASVCTRVRVLHLYLNYTICLRSSVNNNNNNTCLLGDAILRIPRSSGARDMRVSARIARGIRMMASFQRLKKSRHLSGPFYIRQWRQYVFVFMGDVYVTMQITVLARKSALINRLRQRVASLTLDCNGVFAIKAYCPEHQIPYCGV